MRKSRLIIQFRIDRRTFFNALCGTPYRPPVEIIVKSLDCGAWELSYAKFTDRQFRTRIARRLIKSRSNLETRGGKFDRNKRGGAAPVCMQEDRKIMEKMSPKSSIEVVMEHEKVYHHHRGIHHRGGMNELIPTQGVVMFLCIVLALLLKAEDFGDIMQSLSIATEVVRPLLAPVVLAVCGFLLLEMAGS
ncbi:hypothetical protein R1sor_015336 [Riccia sorocarpa]|uniref:Uncharacterized protein n=1 Tax=Riccia sorocarpa TaxID=122646 RepID=A0ABD3HBZ0_9MARC